MEYPEKKIWDQGALLSGLEHSNNKKEKKMKWNEVKERRKIDETKEFLKPLKYHSIDRVPRAKTCHL